MQSATANPRKTTSFRDLGRVDIAALQAAVFAIPESVWARQDAIKPIRYDALDRTAHIVFRFVSTPRDWRETIEGPLWPEWRSLLEPVLNAAAAPYGYARPVFPRIMLARMPPGGSIHPHRDANRAAKWPHKIHVPLKTNPGVLFFVDGAARNLVEGEAVEVNNMAVHAVENRGDDDRIHLVFECYDDDQPEPDWLHAEAADA